MIAFDIDGVVADTHKLLRDTILKECNIDINNHIDNKGWIRLPGKTDEETDIIVRDIIYNNYLNLEPLPHSISTLEFFYVLLKRPLLFISARKIKDQTITDLWISKYLDPSVKFSANCIGSHNKTPYLLSLSKIYAPMYFVEDNLTIATELIENVPNLTGVYLIDNPGNKCNNLNRKITRCKDLLEVFQNYLENNIG